MKLSRLFSPGLLVLAMSFGVTVGSVYVTVSTAAGNAVAEAVTLTEFVEVVESTMGHGSVELTADGGLLGRFSTISAPSGELVPTPDVEVILISGSGDAVSTTSGPDGMFAFGGLAPGVYTVNANSPEGRLSYGIRAIRNYAAVAQSDAQPVSIALDLQLDSALTLSRDSEAIDTVISDVTVASVESSGEFAASEFTQTSYSGSYMGHAQFELNPDGSLDSHVILMHPVTGNVVAVSDLTVSFISDNVVVASTAVLPDGAFTQHNLQPGVYSMVISGSDGIAYHGIDVALAELAETEATQDYIPAAARARQANQGTGMVQGSGGLGVSGPAALDGDTPPTGGPAAGLAPAGGALASGGGTPGDGGFGVAEVLSLAAVGLASAALADDDGIAPATPGN